MEVGAREPRHIMTMIPRKNILVIMSDQHAYRRIGCYGDPIARTPNLDRLASEGMRFDATYCPAPVCVPSRMSFMTGRKPSHINVVENFDILSSAIPTWADMVSKAGYETALIGRMHFEGPDQYHGFDFVHPDFKNWNGAHAEQQFIYSSKVPVDNYWSERNSIEDSGSGKTYVQFNDERVCDAACDYLEKYSRRRDKPFAAVVGFYMPHPPYIGRTDLFENYFKKNILDGTRENVIPQYLYEYFKDFRSWWNPEPIDRMKMQVALSAYYAMIEHMDSLVGNVLSALENSGLSDNTVVIYTSDHGDMSSVKNCWGKLLFYEESARVPLLIRSPGAIKPGSSCPAVCNLRDLAQTICDIAGADPLVLTDARSLIPLLRGISVKWENYTESELCLFPIIRQTKHAVCKLSRFNEWKLWGYAINGEVHYSLFNMNSDPLESIDCIDEERYSAIVEELKSRLRDDWDYRNILSSAILRKQDRRMCSHRLEAKGLPNFNFPKDLDSTINKDYHLVP